jgi:hypothetical protein
MWYLSFEHIKGAFKLNHIKKVVHEEMADIEDKGRDWK